MEKLKLKGRNYIVTGANGGMGRAIVKKIASEGGNIWACDITEEKEYQNIMGQIEEETGVLIHRLFFDLSDERAIKNSLKSIIMDNIPIDGVVNNAGIVKPGTLLLTSLDTIKKTMEVNYYAPLTIMQLVSRQMIKNRRGSIVNIASASAVENYGGNISYGSSKAALIWATKEVAQELAPFNIRVNAISPGITHTNMNMFKSEQQNRALVERTAFQREADPKEIANVVAFLLSDESSYITGHNLIVDGGRTHH